MMMIDAMEDVRFAYDQGMVADSEGGLQKLMDGLNRMAKEYDMKDFEGEYKEHKSYESIKKRRRCNKHNN